MHIEHWLFYGRPVIFLSYFRVSNMHTQIHGHIGTFIKKQIPGQQTKWSELEILCSLI